MTLTVDKMQRVKEAFTTYTTNCAFSDVYLVDVGRAMKLRRADSVLIAEFDRLIAIEGWRDRFWQPANNPFR